MYQPCVRQRMVVAVEARAVLHASMESLDAALAGCYDGPRGPEGALNVAGYDYFCLDWYATIHEPDPSARHNMVSRHSPNGRLTLTSRVTQ